MRILNDPRAMQRLAGHWRSDGVRVGFVPTMGCLHAGHLSLVRHVRRLVGQDGKVVLSIYVNPTQFGPKEDFSRYPRNLKRDFELCRAEGVDAAFAPRDDQMYPGKPQRAYSTFVVEEQLSRGMEGASRPGHFRGVTTIVAKLFNIVLPDVAVFGAKDWQQAAVVQRMTADLNFPVKIVVAPTLRESDGLAMSSRNKYLLGPSRRQARVLWRCILAARAAVAISPKPISSASLKSLLRRVLQSAPSAKLDYVEFFDPRTLAPTMRVTRGVHMAIAAFVGKTRLIDNARL